MASNFPDASVLASVHDGVVPRRVTIICPVYNEETVLPSFFAAMSVVIPELEKRWNVRFDLLFVDDGSRDSSSELIAASLPLAFPVRLLKLSRNFGKEAALTAGLTRASDADAVILMDCDLQHPPALLDTMLKHWITDGYDVAYTVKTSRKGEGIGKAQLANIFYWLVNFGNRFQIPREAEDFRLLSARAVAAMQTFPERERLMKGLYAWIGFRQIAIPFDKPPRVGGQSSFPPLRLFLLAIDGITAFTVTPLRMMASLGILIALLSFVYGTGIIVQKLIFGVSFPGLASILVMISFFGGMQLIAVGLVGEYVGRTLTEVKHRPLYLVETELELNSDPGGLLDHAAGSRSFNGSDIVTSAGYG